MKRQISTLMIGSIHDRHLEVIIKIIKEESTGVVLLVEVLKEVIIIILVELVRLSKKIINKAILNNITYHIKTARKDYKWFHPLISILDSLGKILITNQPIELTALMMVSTQIWILLRQYRN